MKVLISIIAVILLLVIGISCIHPSKKDQSLRYLHYRKQYSHNLKNPFVDHYRKLSCDLSIEVGSEEKKNKDEP